MFILDNKLQQDSFFIADLKLSQLRLMNDSNYPWLILIPRHNGLKEIIDLSDEHQIILLQEIKVVAKILQQQFRCDKLNIANLGNIVSQLHIHVIARHHDDCAFPKPVWGAVSALPYLSSDAQNIIDKINQSLNESSQAILYSHANSSNCSLVENDLKMTQLKKIIFRAVHRGCKETDFLLGNFFEAKRNDLNKWGLDLCEKFLEEDDLKIYDWILNREPRPQQYHDILQAISAFHNIDN